MISLAFVFFVAECAQMINPSSLRQSKIRGVLCHFEQITFRRRYLTSKVLAYSRRGDIAVCPTKSLNMRYNNYVENSRNIANLKSLVKFSLSFWLLSSWLFFRIV